MTVDIEYNPNAYNAWETQLNESMCANTDDHVITVYWSRKPATPDFMYSLPVMKVCTSFWHKWHHDLVASSHFMEPHAIISAPQPSDITKASSDLHQYIKYTSISLRRNFITLNMCFVWHAPSIMHRVARTKLTNTNTRMLIIKPWQQKNATKQAVTNMSIL